jgi:succinate dehydrogenase / fumarate reductase cytochrome b subunit
MSAIIVSPWRLLLSASIGQKFLVAAAGAFLAIFALGHTLGNLQIFLGPDAINRYAWHLHSLPYGLLWLIRAVVLAAILVHVALAAKLHAQNSSVQARRYRRERYLSATTASRSMMLTGAVILAFLIFHILHFTTRDIADFSDLATYRLPGVDEPVMNVYAMMYLGFSNVWVSAFYILACGLLALHLSHGVASAFQSAGWRNRLWRKRLERFAAACAAFVFLGLSSIPLSVLADARAGVPIFDRSSFAALLPAR